jgi:hypothetical protein
MKAPAIRGLFVSADVAGCRRRRTLALDYHEHPFPPREVRMSWSGIILVVVGALLLANNFGMLSLAWLHQWWPVLLIVLGLLSIIRPQHGRRRSRDAETTERAGRDADPRP